MAAKEAGQVTNHPLVFTASHKINICKNVRIIYTFIILKIIFVFAVFSSAISKTYEFPSSTTGQNINVQEVMLETKLSYHIPLQYL